MGVLAASRVAGLIFALLLVAGFAAGCAAQDAGGASVGEWAKGGRDEAHAPGSGSGNPAIAATATPVPTSTALPTATPIAVPRTAATQATATATPAPLPATLTPSQEPPVLPATADLVTRAEPGQGEIALLFNADSFEGHISTILDTARERGAKLTFFLTGGYLERYSERVREIDAAGHEVACHGYKHADYRELSSKEIVGQIDRWREKFGELTGKTGPAYWQPPYGYSNDMVRRAAAGQGYRTIYWTRDVLDAVGQPKSKQFVLDRVLGSSIELDGAIILMHVDKDGTVAALPEVLDGLAQRGLRAVTVSELLRR